MGGWWHEVDVDQVTIRNAYVDDNDCRGTMGRHPGRGALKSRQPNGGNWRRGPFQDQPGRNPATSGSTATASAPKPGTGVAASPWLRTSTSRSIATGCPATATGSPGPGGTDPTRARRSICSTISKSMTSDLRHRRRADIHHGRCGRQWRQPGRARLSFKAAACHRRRASL